MLRCSSALFEIAAVPDNPLAPLLPAQSRRAVLILLTLFLSPAWKNVPFLL